LGLNFKSNFDNHWLGSNYGGFYLNPDNLNNQSVIYSFGLGEDITFDLAVINKFKCKVFGFDPTPKSLIYIEQFNEKNLIVRPIGIGMTKGTLNFYLPKNPDHVSGSLFKNQNLDTQIEVMVDNFENLAGYYNHKEIDVLKMDIEGTEFEVIPDIINSEIIVKQLLVEFHPRFYWDGYFRLYKTLKLLKLHGYKCYAISSSFNELSFIKV
jgi:FkbM family methyltransferase